MFPVPTLKPSLSFCNTNLYLKGDYKKEGIQVDSDGARGNGFKLKEGRFRLSVRGKFFTEWVARHRQAREAGDAPIPGGVQGQVTWGPGQPDLVFDGQTAIPAHGRRAGTRWSLRSLPTHPCCDSHLSLHPILRPAELLASCIFNCMISETWKTRTEYIYTKNNWDCYEFCFQKDSILIKTKPQYKTPNKWEVPPRNPSHSARGEDPLPPPRWPEKNELQSIAIAFTYKKKVTISSGALVLPGSLPRRPTATRGLDKQACRCWQKGNALWVHSRAGTWIFLYCPHLKKDSVHTSSYFTLLSHKN